MNSKVKLTSLQNKSLYKTQKIDASLVRLIYLAVKHNKLPDEMLTDETQNYNGDTFTKIVLANLASCSAAEE
jgi:hypothetical protein